MLIVGHDVQFALIKGRVVGDMSLIDGLDSTGFLRTTKFILFSKARGYHSYAFLPFEPRNLLHNST